MGGGRGRREEGGGKEKREKKVKGEEEGCGEKKGARGVYCGTVVYRENTVGSRIYNIPENKEWIPRP